MESTGACDAAERPNHTRLALISVSDKTGIIEFAQKLRGHGYGLLSTGGTAAALREAGLEVTEVSDHTGSPEIMGGRVKTLHPMIHGGLLGREVEDRAVMSEQGIVRIDMLVLNLYPFEKVTTDPDCRFEDAIENIDIGGPAMLRSAAKNFQSVCVVTSPSQYDEISEVLDSSNGMVPEKERYQLAVSAFNNVARYDAAISNWLSARGSEGTKHTFPDQLNTAHRKLQELRYGENPHQSAAWYTDPEASSGSLSTMRQLQGKPLSFNNINDTDAAWQCVLQFDNPACVIVKHANPCGVASAENILAAYEGAYATDPTSAFGGIIAFNREVNRETAAAITGRQFVEVMIAPGFTDGAIEQFAQKSNLRVLELPVGDPATKLDIRTVSGGLLVQDSDMGIVDRATCKVVTQRAPTEQEWTDLLFAWKTAKSVKSNAIVYAAGGRTMGIGAGQMSRVDSARIAAWKASDAGLDLNGAAMASDAFFPFRDGIDTAANAGASAVIQPGGSKRDDEVIAAADEHGMTMVFTGMRHFKH